MLDNKTQGGLHLTPEQQTREQSRIIKGELIASNEFAFADRILQPDGSYSYVEWKEKPEIGDTVYFEGYCGLVLFTEDGQRYRSLLSSDLTGFEKQSR